MSQQSRPKFQSQALLSTPSISVHDVLCDGSCRECTAEEHVNQTHLVFPYRGAFVRHLGRVETVAQANHVLFFNADEAYRVSHPVTGGDSCLSVSLDEAILAELIPAPLRRKGSRAALSISSLQIDARAQVMLALLRHGLKQRAAEPLEGQTLALTLVRRSLGTVPHASGATHSKQKIVDRAKLVLASDLTRRWTLDDIAAQVGVSPVYLTQLFQQVEGTPLYRYQMRLRLARALDLLDRYEDLTTLSVDLGFSSHSHFTASFRQMFGRTPRELQRAVRLR
jgi:AraC-like DNA-binding protein